MKVLRRSSKNKRFIVFWIVFTIIFVYYVEVFVYYINTFKWFKPACDNPKDCTSILLVADPQIIGNYNEIFKRLTWFTIFDSDRYLKKTYSYAYNFANPDLVIFLGDLMDEGQTAEDEEFNEYVRRIFKIFLYDYSSENVRHIWLPGDNDIGGEEFHVHPHKQKRFDRAFAQPDTIAFKNNTYFKVNRLTMSIPVYKQSRDFYNTDNLFIGLSHLPLMFLPSPFVQKVVSKMLPQLIFTAHEHKSMIISTDALLRQDYHIVPINPDNNQVFEYTLGVTDMYEFIIPTCSYRMGTRKIGYGHAILEKNELRFSVLWSPSRFEQLISYLFLFISFVISFIVFNCRCCIKSRNIVSKI